MVYSTHLVLYRQVVFPMKVLKDMLAALAMTSNLFCSYRISGNFRCKIYFRGCHKPRNVYTRNYFYTSEYLTITVRIFLRC